MPLLSRSMLSVVLVCCGLVFLPSVQASPQSSIWLSYSEDDENGRDTRMDIYWGVSEDDNISFGIGRSQSDFLGQETNTDQYRIAYQTFRLAPYAINLGYEYWGESRELEIHTVSIGLTHLAEHTTLGINLEHRELNLFTREFQNGQRKIDTTAVGYGPVFEWYAGDLTWSVNAMWYDYSEDPAQLNTLKALFLLGRRSFDRAGSLNEWEVATGLRYRFTAVSLGIHYLRSKAAIDGAESVIYAMRLGVNAGKHWTVELEGGQVENDNTDPYPYGLISIGYKFN